ncbi:hypothetical protein DFQ14_107197 [Halopolyspora algeriensis]|uniref:Uncharacterized protein n=1 Tax=Halopolyspora algeriensis TaxID=1500506 RepID=A0A368VS62_9ACTN|nr:hypothetical protein [Halopolyspora algeriensis]RCW43307.1 hypothetical protein DFQ14_107197 [Halopolyspora algeriensis]TQM56366.1 hypothetical protein FHU43_1160 [Halopolyspora algeriensis]
MWLKELNAEVRTRLDTLDGIAAEGSEHAVVRIGRTEIPHLVATVRTLMNEHQPGEYGECRVCSRQRRRWLKPFRRPKAPCRVYLAARRALLDERNPAIERGTNRTAS